MRNELTNLLPRERQRALSRDYFLRLGVVGAILLSMLALASALLLVPTYLLLTENTHAKEVRLAGIESTLASSDETTLSARLAALTNEAAVLNSLANVPTASEVVRDVLAVSRPGVTLSGFAYTPSAGGIHGTLAVSGTATTRDALRSYQLALQSAPFVASADLPVSAYAMDTNVAFTITLTLAP